jgi:ABC-2 type transport system ATP-binding protein
VKLQFDSSATRVEDVIAQLAQAGSIVDITISDPPLEEVIRAIYAETEIMGRG